MVNVNLFTPAGERAGQLEIAEEIFGIEPNRALLHQAIVTTLANMRQGTADTKTRGEVCRTTKKAWRQKGTGRARQGSRSAPHWAGGGVVFGPHPRDYSKAFPKKMRRRALLSALSVKAADDAIFVVEEFAFTAGKTKLAISLMKSMEIADRRSVLVVLDDYDEVTVRAFRNLPNVMLVTSDSVGTYDVLRSDCLLFSRKSIELLQQLKQQPLGINRWIAEQSEGGAV